MFLQVFEFGNGDVYKGEFLDDDIHGEGGRCYADGGRYVGNFKVLAISQARRLPRFILTIYRVVCDMDRG